MADTTDIANNTPAQPETYQLQIRIPVLLNRAVRVKAAKQDKSITEAVCAALESYAGDELAGQARRRSSDARRK